ncbi:MAG: hypothetical protein KKA07_15885 [Bacteroidetes bacterium]|nr:hypothetical protein [Bacteroidota bacterium]
MKFLPEGNIIAKAVAIAFVFITAVQHTFAQNVGIGVATPVQKLEISGNLKISDESTPTTTVTLNGLTSAYLRMTNSDGYISLTPINTGWAHIYTDKSRFFLANPLWLQTGYLSAYNTANLTLQTNGTTRMTILQTNGYTGIGETSPTQMLDVNGDALIQGNDIYGSGSLVFLGAGGGYVETKSNSSSWGLVVREYNSSDYGNVEVDANGFNFGYKTDGAHMTISPAGNVGIGEVAPGYKLHVAGDVRLTSDLLFGTLNNRTQTKNDAGGMSGRSGFYETGSPAPAANWPTGASSYWHLLDCRHSNVTNNYALQIAGSFYDQTLYYRTTHDDAAAAWTKVLCNPRVTIARTTTTELYVDEYIKFRWEAGSNDLQFSPVSTGNWCVFAYYESCELTGIQNAPHSGADNYAGTAGSWTSIHEDENWGWDGWNSLGGTIYFSRQNANTFPTYEVRLLFHNSKLTTVIRRFDP